MTHVSASAVGLAESASPGGPSDPLGLLRLMLRSRAFDRRAALWCRQGRAWFHISSAGHEALVGAAVPLRSSDLIFPHYRDRTLLMARGMTVADLTRDLLALRDSHSGGRNMAAHFCHRPGNIFSVASPVGSQCLPAAGAAWAARLDGTDDVVLCSVGEASTRQGEFFEALAFAVDHDQPVIFLVSDNGYGISTPTRGLSPVHRPLLHQRLVERVDGTDPYAVADAVGRAADRARTGGGPTVLWCDLDRLDSHTSSDDHRVYRSTEEIARLRDPIRLFADRLVRSGRLSREDLDRERTEARTEVEAEMAAVLDEPLAAPETVREHLFAVGTPCALPPEGGSTTIVEAVNGVLRRGLREYPEMLVFGEDVEDPKGGVFGFTKGLGDAAGGRVFNSPLAEATILGTAVGLAARGRRPVVELQFIDFIGPAWNQLASQLTTLRWRTMGAWTCPVVIYAPWGGYLPGGGIWHSQSNEALFTHLPGLRVAVVSQPADAEAVFLAAFAAEDPTLILIPKHLMRVRHAPHPPEPAPPGTARILRVGTDVTVLTWGNGVELAGAAADELAADGVSVEVVDLRWLTPWDRATVSASLRRTGRLIVVQEDNRTSSFGASLIADLATADQEFFSLLAPPRLVSRDDVHVPFQVELERAVLPTVADVVAAVRSVLA